MPDRIVERRADRVAEHSAEHRGDGRDQREPPGARGSASAIGASSTSGGMGKNELSAKATAASEASACGLWASALTRA